MNDYLAIYTRISSTDLLLIGGAIGVMAMALGILVGILLITWWANNEEEEKTWTSTSLSGRSTPTRNTPSGHKRTPTGG